jgi:hypothetical protein
MGIIENFPENPIKKARGFPIKGLNYSNLSSLLHRIHQASLDSEKTGIPVSKLFDQDKELHSNLRKRHIEDQQRGDFIKTVGRLGLGASLMPMGNLTFAANDDVNGQMNALPRKSRKLNDSQ